MSNTPPKQSFNQKITSEEFGISNEFQNNMVVQRDKPLPIWGKATTNTTVKVKVSWDNGTYSAVADTNGNWRVSIPAAGANTNAQTISCSIDETHIVTLTNILIGDVWLCSGQSNMEMEVAPVSPYWGVINYEQEVAAANYPNIRFQTIQADLNSPMYDYFSNTNSWQVCSPATVGNVSAVGYFFARKLHTTLNVPVGIIVSAFENTSCYDWWGGGRCYGGMINPMAKLSIKGFIWYQGETDQHMLPVTNYTDVTNRLIQYWRNAFDQGLLPFYFVQLTPFAEDYFDTNPVGGNLADDYLAKFREAQAGLLKIPATGMAVTMDVGEASNHHPRNKKPVGERLALLALKNTYNLDVTCNGPRYLSYTQNGLKLIINYVNGTAEGLNTINNAALNQLFFVAGADAVFRNAPAVITGNTVVLSVPDNLPGPVVAVRYAFTNAPITNLQNAAGLPAEPFRTDNW
ncbi:sialate O-acetylesterase [Mucilaginibacter ximonensis]|uniref:Sialate O-acetylesterase n=1 Tax=Mucilaginibacter ximonensis TaxID=538021 RepID=A0ABW5Y910_9SPHI